MTRPHGEGAPATALLVLALVGLLALAERAGLPPPFVKGFLAAAAALTLALVVAGSAAARERPFMGLDTVAGPAASGLVLAASVWTISGALGAPEPGPSWLAALAGAPAGILGAHVVERLARRGGSRLPDALDGVRAVIVAFVGALLLLAALPTAAAEAARVFGLASGPALLLATSVVLAPTLLGGARGAMALGAAAAGLAAVVLIALAGAGLTALGPLPLPGHSEAATLQAVAEARARWGLGPSPYPVEWPSAASFLERAPLQAFAASFAAAAAVTLAGPPAVRAQRRGVAAWAAAAILALPIMTTAVAGYAIEAAATRFVGASASRPPPALVEASALGLVTVCGAASDQPDALRAACGISPRDPMRLDWEQIGLSKAYLDSGLAAALNLPSTASLVAGALRLALALAAAALGLWIAARAIGLDGLGRGRRAAGYASLRQGLVRLAAVGAAGAAAGIVASGLLRNGAPTTAAWLLGVAALSLAAIGIWRASRRKTEPALDPPAPPAGRRTRAARPPRGAAP